MLTKGFTIVELLVVIVVVGVLAGALFGPLDDLYTSNVRSLKTVSVTADSHNVLDTIQNTVALSSGFLTTNNVADPSGTTWHSTNSGVNNVLITSNYATTVNEAQDPTGLRTLVLASDCSTNAQNNYVFFVSSGTLYRRTLKNTATCTNNNGQIQTCAAGFHNAACKGVDAALVTGVTSFTVQYYSLPADTSPTSSPTTASTVVLNVTNQVGTGSQIVTSTNSLRVTHLN